MTYLIIGLVMFFGIHSTSIVALEWRNRMVANLGQGPWKGLYSVIAIVGFVLILWGYGIARQSPISIYTPPFWLRHVSAVLMLPVFPLLLATYLPGHIQRVMKHPMLNAIKFWALAHLISNGNLADLLLFGSFLTWAVVDRISVKRRPVRSIPRAPLSKFNDAVAVVSGLILYVAFIKWLHVRWIGVVPFP